MRTVFVFLSCWLTVSSAMAQKSGASYEAKRAHRCRIVGEIATALVQAGRKDLTEGKREFCTRITYGCEVLAPVLHTLVKADRQDLIASLRTITKQKCSVELAFLVSYGEKALLEHLQLQDAAVSDALDNECAARRDESGPDEPPPEREY